MIRKILIVLNFIVISFSSLSVQGQGYVLSDTGQKLQGKVKLIDPQHVRLKGAEGIRIYTVSSVREFTSSQGKVYRPTRVAGEDTLLKFRRLLVNGPTLLFQDSSRYLLMKSGSDSVLVLEEIKTVLKGYQKVKKQYLGAFTYAMADCPSLQGQISDMRFELKSMSRLVHAYNTCTQPEKQSTLLITPELVRWEWGLNLQGAITSAAFVGERLSASYASLKFNQGLGYGAGAHIQANVKNGWSVRMGLLYVYRPHKATGKTEFYTTNATLNNQWIEFPLSAIRYFRLNRSIWKPYVSAGAMMAFGNHGQNERTTIQINGASVTDPLKFGQFAFGLHLGAGVRLSLAQGNALDIEYLYQQVAAKSTTSARFYASLLQLRWIKAMKYSR